MQTTMTAEPKRLQHTLPHTVQTVQGADATSLGLYYTMPAGTELRFVWGEVKNESYSRSQFGIGSDGVDMGGDRGKYPVWYGTVVLRA